MTYLHHDNPMPVIHGDLKPSNVLLDRDFVAKVADFGISKFVNPLRRAEAGEASASTFRGTVGYMPPEYAFAAIVSTKGDVFSYGVLLLELLSGRPLISREASSDEGYRDTNLQHFQESPMGWLDPILQLEGMADALRRKQMILLARVAFFSTRLNPQSRPSMKDIRSMLLQIKDLQVVAATRRTMEELVADEANVVDVWETQDLNDVALPTISS